MNRTLENAVVRLLKQRPFYGQLLLACRRESGAGGHSCGITIRAGVPVLSVNDAQFAAESAVGQEALLEHLIKHLLHLHFSRGKGRNSHDWDMACDLAINPGITGLSNGAPLPEMFSMEEGLAAEEYYNRLVAPFDCGNQEGKGIGTKDRDQGGGAGSGDEEVPRGELSTVDDHEIWADADSTPLQLAEEMVRSMTRDAWRGAAGDVPPDIRPLVAGLLASPPVPWRRVLRQFVATAGRVGRTSTWMREHRRFGRETPGIRKRRRLNLLVGIDVSDSTNAPELREAFAGELVRIARGADANLTVVYASSRIRRIEHFRGHAISPDVFHGGGFTDLRPLFDHARTMNPRPAAIIYLTDGFGPAPERMEFPTLWVLTAAGEQPAPWGVAVRLDV
jgi:predicted metal-dependent peptidase